jgi:hypothetical protein
MINPVTGHWVGGVDENGEADEDAPPDRTPPQRIVPYVEDRRNVLIVRPPLKRARERQRWPRCSTPSSAASNRYTSSKRAS